MRLRFRQAKSGQQYTLNIDDDTTSYNDLIKIVSERCAMPVRDIHLRHASPPFNSIDPAIRLDLQLRSGDTLLLEEHKGPSDTSSSSSSLRTPKSESNASRDPSFNAAIEHQSNATFTDLMRKHSIPDDNSCLFNSIGYALMNADISQSTQLRQLICDTILMHKNQAEYSDQVLGMPVLEYVERMKNPTSWGGAIELKIFSQHFQTEIVAIDVETLKPYRFGESENYAKRVFLLYSGIHYDVLEKCLGSSDSILTVFDTSDEMSFIQALSVAEQENKAKRYTNTATFSLKCGVCGEGFVGQIEAQKHASKTGHLEFKEY